jgi:hypothetical protein
LIKLVKLKKVRLRETLEVDLFEDGSEGVATKVTGASFGNVTTLGYNKGKHMPKTNEGEKKRNKV